MTTPVLLSISDAAKAASVSVDTLRRAIHKTEPAGFPPPLRAKRRGDGPTAAVLIEYAELVRWAASLPDA